MIQGKKVLGIIPARGGSKGAPGKNIRMVAGKPLIAWTIEAAQKSKYIDRLILSSDDADIIKVAKEWGLEVPFVRPPELAQDETPGVAPVLHSVNELPGYDYVVLLQPTSPLRNTEDIDKCLEMCLEAGAHSCVSVTEPEHSPYLMYTIEEGTLHPLLKNQSYVRRQDMPKVYTLNGAVYVAETEWLLRGKVLVAEDTFAYLMPLERSVDVDEEIDLLLCDALLSSS
mgnify:CR=1 FL=1